MKEMERWFRELEKIGAAPGGGFYRGSYTEEETQIHRLLRGWMEEAGLSVRRDAAGNLWGRMEGTCPELLPVVTGSHIDSVRNGGNYDGIYGVLGGLAAVRNLIKEHGVPRRTIEVVAFTGEEGSRFPIGLMGSLAAVGLLDEETVRKTADAKGISVAEAMENVGLDAGRLKAAVHGNVGTYLEMHIEQGPVLERAGIPVGIVQSIVGTQQFHVIMRGEAGHAGTVPMAERKDPMLCAARAIARLPEIARNSGDGVITVGRIWAKPDAENVIPGEVWFSVDLRHPAEEIKQQMAEAVRAVCGEEAQAGGCGMTWVPYPNNLATEMAPELKALLEDACKSLGYPYKRMSSGAGHDAMNMAMLGPVGMLFIPCRGGRSHCPEEFASPEDMEAGRAVLQESLYRLAYEEGGETEGTGTARRIFP